MEYFNAGFRDVEMRGKQTDNFFIRFVFNRSRENPDFVFIFSKLTDLLFFSFGLNFYVYINFISFDQTGI